MCINPRTLKTCFNSIERKTTLTTKHICAKISLISDAHNQIFPKSHKIVGVISLLNLVTYMYNIQCRESLMYKKLLDVFVKMPLAVQCLLVVSTLTLFLAFMSLFLVNLTAATGFVGSVVILYDRFKAKNN